MNPFDTAVVVCLLIATFAGWRAGLLRSLATILAYLCAAPAAILVAPSAARALGLPFDMHLGSSWLTLFGTFLVIGMLLGAALRLAIGVIVGEEIGAVDRAAGAVLGTVRILLVAVLIVLVFDRIIPKRVAEPGFLAGSKLRPLLSAAGVMGVRKLPPEAIAQIDRLKRERGI